MSLVRIGHIKLDRTLRGNAKMKRERLGREEMVNLTDQIFPTFSPDIQCREARVLFSRLGQSFDRDKALFVLRRGLRFE